MKCFWSVKNGEKPLVDEEEENEIFTPFQIIEELCEDFSKLKL